MHGLKTLRGATRTGPDATALVVFAKAPQPGRVKTRLAPLLGEQGAARLHARMIEDTLRVAVRAGFERVELHCVPHARHATFSALAQRHSLILRAQGRGDLGVRMQRAFERALRTARVVVLIGTDCPVLRVADLRAAARALQGGADAALSPAEDGGYALIGLRRTSPRLFSGIEWGSDSVLAQTRLHLRELGWRWRELRTVWDVDRPEDYARLERLRPLRHFIR
ncbi:MAG TPA: TIGR04282 family arsenosugar biosynthesis glycosyltransferase [Burkholderiales bacterium]|nr:TIGR04282 family arsenosugar biosynthesis glycosyltransferase [Burkholderiales bacterium]